MDRQVNDKGDEESRIPKRDLAVVLALVAGIGIGGGAMYWAATNELVHVVAMGTSGDGHGGHGDRHGGGDEGGHRAGHEGGHGDEHAAPNAVVELPQRLVAAAGVKASPVEVRSLAREIRAVGMLDFDEKRMATVSARIAGRIDKLDVDFTGIHVTRGQKLLELYSPDLVSTQQEFLLALSYRERLRESPLQEVVEGADLLAAAARRRLALWGITDEQIAVLERERQPRIHMTVHSPLTGTVIEKKVLQGQYVAAGDAMYKIADLSSLWLIAEVYEAELAKVRIGQPVAVTVPSYPERVFSGRVAFINPVLDSHTRTAKVRVDLPNRGGLLKPQMFAQAKLKVPVGAKVLVVPRDAVLDAGDKQYAWVESSAGQYERRELKVGAEADGYYEVLSGLTKGEKVVTAANFLIDSQAQLKAGAAAGGHGGHGGH